MEMFWFLSPHRDKYYQWYWGRRKVALRVLPEEEKKRYLEYGSNTNSNHSSNTSDVGDSKRRG